MLSLLQACASGPSAERGDFPLAAKVGSAEGMSPEQCLANGQAVAAAGDDAGYLIQPGDQLAINFYLNSEFDQEVTVRPDGKISLRLIGDTQARGLTPGSLAAKLDQEYQRELRDPGATVHVKNSPSRRVYVEGQVAHPGAVALQPGMTTLQAISEAGGLTEDAGSGNVVLIRRDACGMAHGTKVDVSSAMQAGGGEEDVALLPSDIVVVPRSGIANVDLAVKQYVKDLIPFSPYIPLF